MTEAQQSAARAFCQILRDRTGHRWELIGDRGPASAPDGQIDTGAFPEQQHSVTAAGTNHHGIESGGK